MCDPTTLATVYGRLVTTNFAAGRACVFYFEDGNDTEECPCLKGFSATDIEDFPSCYALSGLYTVRTETLNNSWQHWQQNDCPSSVSAPTDEPTEAPTQEPTKMPTGEPTETAFDTFTTICATSSDKDSCKACDGEWTNNISDCAPKAKDQVRCNKLNDDNAQANVYCYMLIDDLCRTNNNGKCVDL